MAEEGQAVGATTTRHVLSGRRPDFKTFLNYEKSF
jgi:hypothetical protein